MRFIKIRSLFASQSFAQFHRATTLRTPRELPATAQTEKVLFVNILRLYTLRPTPYTLHLTPENNEMLRFYWSVGKDIAERQYDNKYGSHFYENLSNDLTKVVGNKRGLAPTSLRYTKYFYSLYSPLFENHRQTAEDSLQRKSKQS